MIGGYNRAPNAGYHTEVDAFASGSFSPMSALQGEPREGLACATLDGRIYCMGGSNASIAAMDIVEMFDPAAGVQGSWATKNSLPEQRTSAEAAVVGGTLFLVGGYNGTSYLATVLRYDPIQDTWTPIAPMNYERGGLSLVEIDGRLFAVGGFNGISAVDYLEVFVP